MIPHHFETVVVGLLGPGAVMHRPKCVVVKGRATYGSGAVFPRCVKIPAGRGLSIDEYPPEGRWYSAGWARHLGAVECTACWTATEVEA